LGVSKAFTFSSIELGEKKQITFPDYFNGLKYLKLLQKQILEPEWKVNVDFLKTKFRF